MSLGTQKEQPLNQCSQQTPSPSCERSSVTHVDHGPVEPCRALPGSHCPEGERRVHEDVVRSALQDEDRFRGGQVESKVHRCGDPRPQVHSMVCEEVRGVSETCPSSLSVLHQPVYGTAGTDTGRSSDQGPVLSGIEGQVQGSPTSARGSAESGQLLRRGHCRTDSPGQRRARDPEPATDDCGELLAHDLPAAPSSDPSDAVEALSDGQHGNELRSWMCDEMGKHMLGQMPQKVLDVNYFSNVAYENTGQHNWV